MVSQPCQHHNSVNVFMFHWRIIVEAPSRLQVAATYRLFAMSCIHKKWGKKKVTSTPSEDTQKSNAQAFGFV